MAIVVFIGAAAAALFFYSSAPIASFFLTHYWILIVAGIILISLCSFLFKTGEQNEGVNSPLMGRPGPPSALANAHPFVDEEEQLPPLFPAMLDSMSNIETIQALLADSSTDPNAKNKDGETILHCLAKGEVQRGNVSVLYMIGLLFENSRTAPDVKDGRGCTPLHCVAQASLPRAAERACLAGHQQIASALLKGGANVSAKDKQGVTPLYDAAENNKLAMAELFLQHGASAQDVPFTRFPAINTLLERYKKQQAAEGRGQGDEAGDPHATGAAAAKL